MIASSSLKDSKATNAYDDTKNQAKNQLPLTMIPNSMPTPHATACKSSQPKKS